MLMPREGERLERELGKTNGFMLDKYTIYRALDYTAMSKDPKAHHNYNPIFYWATVERKPYDPYPVTSKDWANVLRDTASGIETAGAGVSNIPPEYIISGLGLLGVSNPMAGLAALSVYGVFAVGPDILRYFANNLDN